MYVMCSYFAQSAHGHVSVEPKSPKAFIVKFVAFIEQCHRLIELEDLFNYILFSFWY